MKREVLCDVVIWPNWTGMGKVTLGFIETAPHEDDVRDVLFMDLHAEEAKAIADMLISASQCKTDIPSYKLTGISGRASLDTPSEITPNQPSS